MLDIKDIADTVLEDWDGILETRMCKINAATPDPISARVMSCCNRSMERIRE